MKVTLNKDLTALNTFRMNVKAAAYAEYNSVDELKQILDDPALPGPKLPIGGGSNLLFTGDFPGTVLHSCIKGLILKRSESGVTVQVGAGESWDEFCAWAASEGLWGPENLSLIPGEVGAAAVQNIRAYGVEVKDIITGVEAMCAEAGYSLILKLTFGENTFLLTGDASGSELSDVQKKNPGCMKVQVLKNPHHHGKQEYAVKNAKPKITVISTGSSVAHAMPRPSPGAQ